MIIELYLIVVCLEAVERDPVQVSLDEREEGGHDAAQEGVERRCRVGESSRCDFAPLFASRAL